ncbi:amino acid--tRNA ligase-related protein, partial [Pseudomonas sp. AH2 (2023)]
SFTSRHATEFTSIDAEISWIDSHEDVAAMQEELLQFAFQAVKDKHGAEITELFGVEVQVPATPFPRIPLAEARDIVAARG